MKRYVAGFLFSEDFERVALIKKNRPDWQKGKLNGIGGHIEEPESPIEAMTREFLEETGATELEWIKFALLYEVDVFDLHFFCGVGDLTKVKTKTDEEIEIIRVDELKEYDTIENLSWLVDLAIDVLKNGRPKFAVIEY